jgi:predicted NAD/FAD-binding protein
MKTKTDISMVDLDSLVVDGIDTRDYPDFCDAYFSKGYYLDGTELPDDVLEELSEDFDLIQEAIHEILY